MLNRSSLSPAGNFEGLKAPRKALLSRLTAIRLNVRLLAQAAAMLGLFAAFLGTVQFSTPGLVGNDGYYHIKLASLMRTEGLTPEFDWLPLTVLNSEAFVDHHFLYHVFLIPFTGGNLVVGAKLATVFFAALAFLAIWWLLRGQGVPYPALWAAGLLVVSEAFLYRMSMTRAQSLSLAVLALALYWTLNGRHRRLLPLAFAYVWLYNAFPLILMMGGVYLAASWLIEGQPRWRPLGYAAAGVGLGLVLNPYFPENLIFIFRHIAPKLADPTAVSVGSEWYPYETAQLLENAGLALAAFIAGIIALGLHHRRMSSATATGLALAVVFGFMLFQSRRFIEYFPAFALIFAALAWSPVLKARRAYAAIRSDGLRESRVMNQLSRRWLAPAQAMAGLLAAGWLNLQASIDSVSRTKPLERYASASHWLKANSPAGSRVFQTDWDDFPRQFFFNSNNTYLVGLDPTYMQSYDPELYDLWVDITRGKVEQPSSEIEATFGSRYVFTDLDHKAFLKIAAEDPRLVEIYRDRYAAIFKVTAAP